MRWILALAMAAGLAACAAQSAPNVAGRTSVAQSEAGLAGAWVVDLSTEPNTPYTKPMLLNLAADHSVTG